MRTTVNVPLSQSQNILLNYGSDALDVSRAALMRQLIDKHLGQLIGAKLRERDGP